VGRGLLENGERVRLKVIVSAKTYSTLCSPTSGSSTETAAVHAAIEKGMNRYWSHWFEIAATENERLKRRYRECQRDSELLRGLMEQNTELEEMLERAGEPT